MRSKKKNKQVKVKNSNRNNKGNDFLLRLDRILAIVYILLVTLVEISVIRFDLLPVKYTLAMLVVLTPITLIVFVVLFFNGINKKLKIVTTVIAFCFMSIFAMGITYLTGTVNLIEAISSVGEVVTYEKFNVVVLADSEIESIDGLNDEQIGISSTNTTNYAKARNNIKELIDCDYKTTDTIEELSNELLNKEYKGIFLSEIDYNDMLDSSEGMEEKVKILYTVEIEVKEENSADRVDVVNEPFSIYVSGIDTYGSIDTVSRSDVNMIVTVNPKTNEILLTSIPRDCRVTLPTFGEEDKLTHAGLFGVNESIGAIENLLGIEINYYLKVNFSTVGQLVDAIGGIDVESDYAFYANEGRPSGGGPYISKGMNHLNGDEALAFARERHAFQYGDFQRVINQQKVIEATITKITGSTTLLMNYMDILGAIEGNMDTNLSEDEIKDLVKMQLDDMPTWEFQQSSIDEGSDALLPGHTYGTQQLYNFLPDQDCVIEASDKIIEVINSDD